MKNYSAEFLERIRKIAQEAGIKPGQAIALWEEYEFDPARNQFQDPMLDEFVKDYADYLQPFCETAPHSA
jgi:hypothetical protein